MAWAMTLTEFLEGKKHKVYWDGIDDPVIGVGFKLKNTHRVKNRLSQYGLNYNSILSGAPVRVALLERFFHEDMQSAVARAVKWVKNFYDLNNARKAAIAYICFTADISKLRKVSEMIEKEKDWEAVAGQLRGSKWYDDKGIKAESICRILSQGEIKEIGKDS